jgi:hypothetical protein
MQTLQRLLGRVRAPFSCLLLSLATVFPLHAATYYFAWGGDDVNGDGSQLKPWQSVTKANSLMVAGNTLRFKRGDVWYLGNAAWNISGVHGTAPSPITIADWTDGSSTQLPVFAHMLRFNSGWTSIGSNVWRHALPPYTPMDCFKDGDRMQQVSGSSSVTATTQWAYDANYVYVYSTNDPATHLVEINADGFTLSADTISYITFQNLEFLGGRWISVGVSVPSDHITFDSCKVIRPGHWGLGFINGLGSSQRNTYSAVKNCYVDLTWETYLNSLTTSNDTNGITLESADHGLVQGNTVADFGHTSIALEGSTFCTVEKNVTYPKTVNYYRALEVFAGPQLPANDSEASTDNTIRQNMFMNQAQVASKLWGQRNKFYGNVFTGARQTVGFNHNTDEGQEADLLTTGETVRDNLIVNNTFYNTGKSNFIVNLYIDAKGGVVQQNTFANNLFVKWGQQSPSYGLQVTPNGSAGTDQLVKNNGFWNISSSEFCIYDAKAPIGSNNYQYTADQANSAITGYSGNVQMNPAFANEDPQYLDLDLQDSSPVGASGTDMRSQMGSGFVDYDGEPWASTPSIGAFQVTTGLVTNVVLSTNTYNAQTQWVGMKFTVGAQNISVTKLGRWVVSGNSAAHNVKLVVASTGVDVPGGATVVNTVGTAPGMFAYGALPAPVTLTAGVAYYLISEETAGGDAWYGYTSTLTTTADIAINSAVAYSGGVFTPYGTGGNAYGPVALKTLDAYNTQFATVQSLSSGFYNNSASWRGMEFTTGSSPVTVGYLGRWIRAGSTQSHTVKIVDAATGGDVTGASVVVPSAGTSDAFAYRRLATPVTLAANKAYYLVSQEFSGGDYWYGSGTVLNMTGVATINSAVYNDAGPYVLTNTGAHSFGPVGFKY